MVVKLPKFIFINLVCATDMEKTSKEAGQQGREGRESTAGGCSVAQEKIPNGSQVHQQAGEWWWRPSQSVSTTARAT